MAPLSDIVCRNNRYHQSHQMHCMCSLERFKILQRHLICDSNQITIDKMSMNDTRT